MRRVIIVQARMTSTRLPGKVLMDVAGRPMLSHQIARLRACREADAIVVATTTNREDDPVVALAEQEGVGSFRGSEHDVLGRYVGAARTFAADLIVRVTADCPLIDPDVTDVAIRELSDHAHECDYVCNFVPRTYPRGLDVEVFFRDGLERVDRLARSTPAREHVTPTFYADRPDLFLRRSIRDREDNSDLRWTVDTPEDLRVIRGLYEDLDLASEMLPYRQVVEYARSRPELSTANASIHTWDPLAPG
jgi:spore coat polysaccharide biosynthesis protein SpsF